MKKNITILLTLTASSLLLASCGEQPTETIESSDTVTISTNSEAPASSATIDSSSTQKPNESAKSDSAANSTSKSTASTEQNALGKEAMRKIEKAKNVAFDDSYLMIIQEQTDDMIVINIRKENDSVTTNYGIFRYTKSKNTIEEIDETTGEYKVLPE
ncbi:hypothetical protein [Granulicatella seriolae]|uniref:Lipoprotein n=1 Tax=Granulicatella seriolae TaxID=2967226 RepID=A0ABT1WM46_9LACT|nr:hypothetical protein [Granulicatella seriolae]